MQNNEPKKYDRAMSMMCKQISLKFSKLNVCLLFKQARNPINMEWKTHSLGCLNLNRNNNGQINNFSLFE